MNFYRKFIWATLIVGCLTMLYSCSFVDNKEYVGSTSTSPGKSYGREIILPYYIPPMNQKVLFNPWNQRFVSYDLISKKDVKTLMGGNYFAYSFNTKCNYFTVGDSFINGFSIVKCDGSSIRELYRLKNQKWEALFPLAIENKNIFYIHQYLAPTSKGYLRERYRIVSKWDEKNKRLIDYSNTKGTICHGVIIDEFLYYTIYDERKDVFKIYRLNFNNTKNRPYYIGVCKDVRGVYNINNNLYILSADGLYNFLKPNEKIFAGNSYYVMDLKDGTILKFYHRSNFGLSAEIINIKTKKVRKVFNNVIGFTVENNKVILFGNGYVEKI